MRACGARDSIKPGATAPGSPAKGIAVAAKRATDILIAVSANYSAWSSPPNYTVFRSGCRPLRGLGKLAMSILGLTPQDRVPSRASRLGWKTLC